MAIDKYEIVIGCEIHTQLLTKTKAFCACENRYGGMPDTRVCPVCLGLPGAMPRVSKGYVELGAVAGQALICEIARVTKFDRKHYFYPDLARRNVSMKKSSASAALLYCWRRSVRL